MKKEKHMAFLDELKTIEATTKSKEEALTLLSLLLKDNERKLLYKHLQTVYQGVKDEIRRFVTSGEYEGEVGKRELTATYRFESFVYTSFDFEAPYPEGITEEQLKQALAFKDELRVSSKIRIEPSFVLKKEKRSFFKKRTKREGVVRFEENSLWFFEELNRMLLSDGIVLKSITTPIFKINRIVTLPAYDAELECSYTVSDEHDYVLGYEEASFITIKYRLVF